MSIGTSDWIPSNHAKSLAGAGFSSVIPMLGVVESRESGSYLAFIGSLLSLSKEI